MFFASSLCFFSLPLRVCVKPLKACCFLFLLPTVRAGEGGAARGAVSGGGSVFPLTPPQLSFFALPPSVSRPQPPRARVMADRLRVLSRHLGAEEGGEGEGEGRESAPGGGRDGHGRGGGWACLCHQQPAVPPRGGVDARHATPALCRAGGGAWGRRGRHRAPPATSSPPPPPPASRTLTLHTLIVFSLLILLMLSMRLIFLML